MIQAARATVREVAPAEANDALSRGDIELVLDVREPGEFQKSHLPYAVNVPRGLLELKADPASPVADATVSDKAEARILVYCTKAPGARSLLAAETLAKMGYAQVEVLQGGLDAWSEQGLPVE